MKILSKAVTVDATTEPITLAAAKRQLRIANTNSDTEITELIPEARAIAEEYCDRYFARQTVRLVYHGFPNGDSPFSLEMPDVVSISSFTYVDDNDTEQTLDTSGLTVDSGRERIRTSSDWPSGTKPAITVVIGTTPTLTPKAVKRAIKMILTDLYENRGAKQAYQVYDNPAVENALTPHRNNLGV